MEVPMHAMHVQAGSCSELSWPGRPGLHVFDSECVAWIMSRMEEPFQAMAVQDPRIKGKQGLGLASVCFGRLADSRLPHMHNLRI